MLVLQIGCDSAAFEHEGGSEIARLLRRVADDMEGEDVSDLDLKRHPLFDMDGDEAGAWWMIGWDG